MNPDKSGHVNLNDFARAMRLKVCTVSEKIFAFLDVGSRGNITFREFLFGSIHVLKQPLFQRACELTFSKCCTCGNQFISKEEFGDAISVSIPDLTDDEVSELFNAFDVDGDGSISYEDFHSYLRKNPLLIAMFSPLVQPNILESAIQPPHQTV